MECSNYFSLFTTTALVAELADELQHVGFKTHAGKQRLSRRCSMEVQQVFNRVAFKARGSL